ncbi:MAG: hypothetical protein ACFE89_06420 [Candidatus Hodarchaeota archaeon]
MRHTRANPTSSQDQKKKVGKQNRPATNEDQLEAAMDYAGTPPHVLLLHRPHTYSFTRRMIHYVNTVI